MFCKTVGYYFKTTPICFKIGETEDVKVRLYNIVFVMILRLYFFVFEMSLMLCVVILGMNLMLPSLILEMNVTLCFLVFFRSPVGASLRV